MTSYNKNDVKRRLENLKEKDYVSKHNAKLLTQFVYQLDNREETSPSRQVWYLSKFSVLLDRHIREEELSTTKLDKLTREDLMDIIYNVKADKREYADKTVNGFKCAFRMFYKNKYPLEFKQPDRVKEILQSGVVKNKKNPERKYAVNLLSPKQVRMLSEVAQNPRDGLLPFFLLDSGGRTSEISDRKIGDFEQKDGYWVGTFHDSKNNKEDRTLPLVHCQSKLQTWLEYHPRSGDEDAPLWVCLSNNGNADYGSKMTKKAINSALKTLGERAEKKYPGEFQRINVEKLSVYDFRHSSASWRGTEKGFGLQQLMWWYAWIDTGRAKTYLKDDNRRMMEAILDKEGLESSKDEESKVSSFEMAYCSRCEEKRSSDAVYCPKCSLPLESSSAMKDSELKDAGEKIVEMKLDGEIEDEEIKEIVEEVKR